MESLRIAASANNVYAHPGARVLGAILVGGSDASSALIYDALTAAGTDRMSIKSVANDCRQIGFKTPLVFNTGISITLAGTGAVLYLLIE